ncbi:homeobox and leucine zipper protein Homez [Latimeria chalumnae]|uniref:homeobox and leucine zipper protein Homez n=1 Tax=Latimeria chalumnae TaxID=7897 RepID=UPI0003C17816|nr:PREDICTED: homeobox and leucine zipper protein Homez [Latimeria chalumnae]|eukprot:XP_014342973.1 PREDICTED: homeobox and leucine zipper protein Homez [Latimeria chalumnae]
MLTTPQALTFSANQASVLFLPLLSEDLKLIWTRIDEMNVLDAIGPLTEAFDKFPYPSESEMDALCQRCGLQVTKVKLWFAIRRVMFGISWSPGEVEKVRWKLAGKLGSFDAHPIISTEQTSFRILDDLPDTACRSSRSVSPGAFSCCVRDSVELGFSADWSMDSPSANSTSLEEDAVSSPSATSKAEMVDQSSGMGSWKTCKQEATEGTAEPYGDSILQVPLPESCMGNVRGCSSANCSMNNQAANPLSLEETAILPPLTIPKIEMVDKFCSVVNFKTCKEEAAEESEETCRDLTSQSPLQENFTGEAPLPEVTGSASASLGYCSRNSRQWSISTSYKRMLQDKSRVGGSLELGKGVISGAWSTPDSSEHSSVTVFLPSSILKKREHREQTEILKAHFNHCQYPNEVDIRKLNELTGLSRREILHWFSMTRHKAKIENRHTWKKNVLIIPTKSGQKHEPLFNLSSTKERCGPVQRSLYANRCPKEEMEGLLELAGPSTEQTSLSSSEDSPKASYQSSTPKSSRTSQGSVIDNVELLSSAGPLWNHQDAKPSLLKEEGALSPLFIPVVESVDQPCRTARSKAWKVTERAVETSRDVISQHPLSKSSTEDAQLPDVTSPALLGSQLHVAKPQGTPTSEHEPGHDTACQPCSNPASSAQWSVTVFHPSSGLQRRKSREQTKILKDYFQRCNYPTEADLHELEGLTGLSRKDITKWFYTARYRMNRSDPGCKTNVLIIPTHNGMSQESPMLYPTNPPERYHTTNRRLKKEDLEDLTSLNSLQVKDWLLTTQREKPAEVEVLLSEDDDSTEVGRDRTT